jgi:hypothetical protein
MNSKFNPNFQRILKNNILRDLKYFEIRESTNIIWLNGEIVLFLYISKFRKGLNS